MRGFTVPRGQWLPARIYLGIRKPKPPVLGMELAGEVEATGDIVLEHLGLSRDKFMVILCTPRRAEILDAHLGAKRYRCISSQDIGLPLGARAMAIERNALPHGVPFQTGGGTARLVSPGWVIWAKAPDRFEAGTPAIVNIIAFARALRWVRPFGANAFQVSTGDHHAQCTVDHFAVHWLQGELLAVPLVPGNFEILQGSVRPAGLMILSMGPPCDPKEV